MITRLMATADEVLRHLETMDAHNTGTTLLLECYENGREHGYAVLSDTGMRLAVFANNRRTDGIVVYTGAASEFHPQGNIPSDEIYSRRRLFSHDEADRAAAFVYEYVS